MNVIMLLALLFLFGCSNDEESKQTDVDLVASEKTLPESFYSEQKKYIVKKVLTQTGFKDVWGLFGFEKNLPTIDFENKDVVFIGLQESNNCPYEIEKENIAFNLNSQSMTVTLPKQYGACFLAATPKTFVIQIDKDTSTAIKNVVILEDETETSITFD